MNVLKEGYKYELECSDKFPQTIEFVHRVKVVAPDEQIMTMHTGTDSVEVLIAVHQRLIFLSEKFPGKEHEKATDYVERAIEELRLRLVDWMDNVQSVENKDK